MFVTFEGPEGSGKSTAIRAVAARLEQQGEMVLVTREPGAALGGRIREILLHGDDLDPLAELFLFLADRAQHVATVVRPALAAGAIVLCDRFADSTIVYQGYGRGLPLDELRRLNEQAVQGCRPDLTLLLDLPAAEGLARVERPDRLDSEPLEFHERVRQGFLEEASGDPDRWVVLNAARSPTQVAEDAAHLISEYRALNWPLPK